MKVFHNPHSKESRESLKELQERDPDFECTVIEYPACTNEYPFVTKYPAVLIECPPYYDDENGNDVPEYEEYATSRAVEDSETSFIDAVIERQERVIERAEEMAPKGVDIGPPSYVEFKIAQREEYAVIRGK